MNNIMFDYNQSLAVVAGQGQYITETGAYICKVTNAVYNASSKTQSESIELTVETKEGLKAKYINIYYKRADGKPHDYGISMINAIMGCAGIVQLTKRLAADGSNIAPELIGKVVGLVLQKILKSKQDGTDTYQLDIKIPYLAKTKQTLDEYVNQQSAAAIDNIVASLKDKDERVKNQAFRTQPHQQQSNSINQLYGDPATQSPSIEFDDDVPF